MPKTVLLDEWHLTFRIPSALPAADVRPIRRAFNRPAFLSALRQMVTTAMRRCPVLRPVRTVVTR